MHNMNGSRAIMKKINLSYWGFQIREFHESPLGNPSSIVPNFVEISDTMYKSNGQRETGTHSLLTNILNVTHCLRFFLKHAKKIVRVSYHM
jgi:hypothetical protein